MIINFKNINTHKGDQKAAFEELICQLARLEKIDNQVVFRRKGRGADGGAECYWITDSGSEICWQAKYFTDQLSESEFNQIDDSVRSALKHHPQMEEYIISVPHNRTDSRQMKTDCTKKLTEMVRWDKRVELWTTWAHENGMNVKFSYWGETEILSKILMNDTSHQGIKDYFFGTKTITLENIVKLFERSRKSLGDRYNQEDNVELELYNVFEALANSKTWIEKLNKNIKNGFKTDFSEQEIKEYNYLNLFNDYYRELKYKLDTLITNHSCFKLANEIRELCITIDNEIYNFEHKSNLNEIIVKLDNKNQYNKINNTSNSENNQISNELIVLKSIRNKLHDARKYIKKISTFLSGKEFRAYLSGIVFLYGEAGIGKSHFLCDSALKLLEKNIPTLFLLGQHYSGGNPLALIKDKLGLNEYNDNQLLSILSSMAESYESRFVIIIDAINEGAYRVEWTDYLIDFLYQIKEHSNISLVISCRTSYKDFIIPNSILSDNEIVTITHQGFFNLEERAVEKYFSRRKIFIPSSPILKPEFSNPLFLKTCCDAIVEKGLNTFPKGLNGFVPIFEFYLYVINDKISKSLNYRPSQNIVFKFINEFIQILFPDNFYFGVKAKEAEALSSKICKKGDLLGLLINEGLLSLDICTNKSGSQEEVVRFTFERYGEHYVAREIISRYQNKNQLKNLFSNGSIINDIISIEKRYEFRGLIIALALYIAEKFNCEFIEFIDDKILEDNNKFFVDATFEENILWRSPKGICQKSFELLGEIGDDAYKILIDVSTEPSHPMNILYLESHLINLEMAVRDSCWSVYIAQEPDWYKESSSVKKILLWFQNKDLTFIQKERLELLSYLLVWFTTTTNCYVRDVSTKLLAKIFYCYPDFITLILNKYKDINDVYILERIYAAVLGAVVYIRDNALLKNISETVYDLQFKDENPTVNIMIREYATLIIEYACSQNAKSLKINYNLCKPPFKSSWTMDIPTKEELDLKLEIQEFPFSLYYLGDFLKYEMQCIKNWSITPIEESNYITGQTLQNELLDILKDNNRMLMERYIQLQIRINSLYEKINPLFFYRNFDKEKHNEHDEYILEKQKINDEIETVIKSLVQLLSDEEKSMFEFVNKHTNDKIVEFDIDLASRFIHKRVLDFGWTNKLFKEFDEIYTDILGRNHKHIECIGKKYQWIALYELIARLSDNYKWIDRNYSDVRDDKYYSAIQISKRNIDPSMFINKSECGNNYYREQSNAWWEMPFFNFSKSLKITPDEWLENNDILPDFTNLLRFQHGIEEWTVLHGFSNYNQNVKDPEEFPNDKREELWYRINAVIIMKRSREEFLKEISNKQLESPSSFSPPEFTSELFYGEFHWNPYFQKLDSTKSDNNWLQENCVMKVHIPVVKYYWEENADDHSFKTSIGSCLPSSLLVDVLNLYNSPLQYGKWKNSNQRVAFLDPSIYEKGNSYALINSGELNKWLEENELELIWLIGGEKQIYYPKNQSYKFGVYGRYTFNMAYAVEDQQIKQIYFKDKFND